MTGDPGPDEQQPEALTPDDPNATKPETLEEEKGKSLIARIPGGRTLLTVVAAIVAVSAIAATTWALARNGDDAQAAPDEDESGLVTLGPNQPDSTSPTLPTSTLPTVPTTPSFPTSAYTFSTATQVPTTTTTFPTYATSSYTYPTSTYTYPTSTYPTTKYTPTPTTPTTTAPVKTQVYPVAPQATPIAGCGTYGKLRFAQTTGVKYALVVGDGKKGRYVVTATARKGYVIAEGATRRFTGSLGRYEECPLGFRKVTAARTGDGSAWAVKVRLWVPDKEERELTVGYAFATDVTLESTGGTGWECGDLVDGQLSCTYTGDGPPPGLKARVLAEGDVEPAGTVGLFADGEQVDVGTFDAGDS